MVCFSSGMTLNTLLLTLLTVHLVGIASSAKDSARLYTNEFAVKISGGHHVAKRVARRLGFEFVDQIGALSDFYLFKESSIPSRSRRSADIHIKSLDDDPEVEWFTQQVSLTRTKRDFSAKGKDIDDKTKGKDIDDKTFDDPEWKHQWYLFDPKRSMNVAPVWNRGITGKGVVVTVIDDGIEFDNYDLQRNYDREASYDFNDEDDDPTPRYEYTNFNSHGTRCAGEIAMEANDGTCGAGVAFNARIGGIRMLDGELTDSLEARSFGFKNNYIDINSCSWGPEDDSQTLEGPGELAFDALEVALQKGRDGKGSIFVWASGNGGYNGDDCGCDGYVSNVGTIAISSVEDGNIPEFTEKCAAILAATYSFGPYADHKIVTTDLHNSCTDEFCGTSASAPLAAGIIALALEANPDLTWRDVQHIVVWSSKHESITTETGWIQNGAGRWFNRAVGLGLMDAEAIVGMADSKTWESVPEKNMCIISSDSIRYPWFSPTDFSMYEVLRVKIPVDGCSGTLDHVKYLEHVELFVHLQYYYRGALNINLTSNSGTETTVLSSRPADETDESIYYWPFVSVHTWGEEPTGSDDTGNWEKTIWDSIREANDMMYGRLVEFFLVLQGTDSLPSYRKDGKSKESRQKSKAEKKSRFPMDTDVHNSRKESENNDEREPIAIRRMRRLKTKRQRTTLHTLHRTTKRHSHQHLKNHRDTV